MRIRRSASRILGSAYFVPAVPSPYAAPCLASLGSRGVGGISSFATPCGEICELNRSPKDLPLSDPQVIGVLQYSMPTLLVKEKKKQVVSTTRKLKAQLQAPKKIIVKKESTSAIEEEKVVVMALAAPSKPSSSSKTRKKKPTNYFNATEGFYYYAGFGPSQGKRHYRSNTRGSAFVPFKVEEVGLEVSKDGSPLN